MSTLCQVGIYQSTLSNPNPFGTPPSLIGQNPYDVTGSYQLMWYAIYQPQQVIHTPPALLGIDLAGAPAVRGYSKMEWQYTAIRPDRWYLMRYLWKLSRQASGSYLGHVKIQWPDPESGMVQIASARWEAISQVARNMPTFTNVALTFSHILIDDSISVSGVWKA